VQGFAGNGFYGTTKIRDLMDQLVTPQLLAEIAAKHQRGGRLFMVTGNFDAIEPVVWDMGKIATQGTPESLGMFKQIIQAAIAIPVAFKPIPITVDGPYGQHVELHGDGGPVAYFYADTDLIPEVYRRAGKGRVYLIMNKIYKPVVTPLKSGFGPMVERTVYEFTYNGMQSLLRQTWNEARRDAVPLFYANLPSDHTAVSSVDFELPYMRETYKLGKDWLKQGTVWKTAKP